jgi:hypothetical protein
MKKRGKQALGKCPYCKSTRKALYEKYRKKWIVRAHYCPICGLIQWIQKPPLLEDRLLNIKNYISKKKFIKIQGGRNEEK